MADITSEVINTHDYDIHYNKNTELNSVDSVIMQNRQEKARQYVGYFPAYQIAETFYIPVMAVRKMEDEKGVYYGGK